MHCCFFFVSDTHFASVSVLSLWSVQFKVFVIIETVPIFFCLQYSLQRVNAHTEREEGVRHEKVREEGEE